MKRVKIQRQQNGLLYVSIPRTFCELNSWGKGDTLAWIKSGEGLLLVKERER